MQLWTLLSRSFIPRLPRTSNSSLYFNLSSASLTILSSVASFLLSPHILVFWPSQFPERRLTRLALLPPPHIKLKLVSSAFALPLSHITCGHLQLGDSHAFTSASLPYRLTTTLTTEMNFKYTWSTWYQFRSSMIDYMKHEYRDANESNGPELYWAQATFILSLPRTSNSLFQSLLCRPTILPLVMFFLLSLHIVVFLPSPLRERRFPHLGLWHSRHFHN
jgi:hypothetical protein